MTLTSIAKAYLFNRALKRWCKDNGIALNTAAVNVLFALSEVTKNRRGASVVELQIHLKRNRHSMGSNFLVEHLTKLEEAGLVQKAGRYPIRFSTTIQGINSLNTIEQQLRKSRPDR